MKLLVSKDWRNELKIINIILSVLNKDELGCNTHVSNFRVRSIL